LVSPQKYQISDKNYHDPKIECFRESGGKFDHQKHYEYKEQNVVECCHSVVKVKSNTEWLWCGVST